jgi:hypothetical protein
VPLLYYLTRALKPDVVVETGVAAGYSAAAFLQAPRTNGQGRLYSSDFPYFRLSQPEKYIGVVVRAELRTNWNLHLEGDRNNLKKILRKLTRIDILHYSSDTSFRGRRNTIRLAIRSAGEPVLTVMDDIGDNSFFCDLVHDVPSKRWRTVRYQEKYIGLVGDLI